MRSTRDTSTDRDEMTPKRRAKLTAYHLLKLENDLREDAFQMLHERVYKVLQKFGKSCVSKIDNEVNERCFLGVQTPEAELMFRALRLHPTDMLMHIKTGTQLDVPRRLQMLSIVEVRALMFSFETLRLASLTDQQMVHCSALDAKEERRPRLVGRRVKHLVLVSSPKKRAKK